MPYWKAWKLGFRCAGVVEEECLYWILESMHALNKYEAFMSGFRRGLHYTTTGVL